MTDASGTEEFGLTDEEFRAVLAEAGIENFGSTENVTVRMIAWLNKQQQIRHTELITELELGRKTMRDEMSVFQRRPAQWLGRG